MTDSQLEVRGNRTAVLMNYYSLPFEGVGVKFIRIFKTNNCQLVYYKDVLELFQVVEEVCFSVC